MLRSSGFVPPGGDGDYRDLDLVLDQQRSSLLHVGGCSKFNKRCKGEDEADPQIDPNRLGVGCLGQVGVGLVHQRAQGQDSGHTKGDPGRGGGPVQPEVEPGHDDDEHGGAVHVEEVVAKRAVEEENQLQSALLLSRLGHVAPAEAVLDKLNLRHSTCLVPEAKFSTFLYLPTVLVCN